MNILDLDAEDQLAKRVQWPSVGLVQISALVQAPDGGSPALRRTAQAFMGQLRDPRTFERKADARRNADFHRLGIARMAEMDTHDAGVEQLAEQPAVGPHIGFIQSDNG